MPRLSKSGPLRDRATEWALRVGGSLPRRLWRGLARVQHQGAAGRRLIELLTRPIRHRDVRIMRGSLAGARINLGGSFLRYLTGDAEPDVQRTLNEVLKPGQVVYDVGANIGFFTMLCSRLVGPQGKVYAFEPMPGNAATLRHNIALNGLSNVVVVEKALSSSSGNAELFISHWSAFHSLNVEGAVKKGNLGPGTGERISVETVTLDEFVSQDGVSAPDLIKIDVEGAELVVVQGMLATLKSTEPLLLCELHGTNLGYLEFVDSIDYQARVIDGDTPELADADRNVHTLAWPRHRESAGGGVSAGA